MRFSHLAFLVLVALGQATMNTGNLWFAHDNQRYLSLHDSNTDGILIHRPKNIADHLDEITGQPKLTLRHFYPWWKRIFAIKLGKCKLYGLNT